jgi:hypothetical protein
MRLDQRSERRCVTRSTSVDEFARQIQAWLGDGHVCSTWYYTRRRVRITGSLPLHDHSAGDCAGEGMRYNNH